jgi:hypothetical protein
VIVTLEASINDAHAIMKMLQLDYLPVQTAVLPLQQQGGAAAGTDTEGSDSNNLPAEALAGYAAAAEAARESLPEHSKTDATGQQPAQQQPQTGQQQQQQQALQLQQEHRVYRPEGSALDTCLLLSRQVRVALRTGGDLDVLTLQH